MDINKLSDVLETALKNTYEATTEKLWLHSGMCSALSDLRISKHITRDMHVKAMDYVDDFMDEMEGVSEQEITFLYQSLASFKGYNTVDLQYLVWEAVIDKLRSQGQ